jgi:hypothetical protein
MEESVCIQTPTARVLMDGREISVKQVSFSYIIISLFSRFHKLALCYEGFCLNNGTCFMPNSSCHCTKDWDGDRCNIGNSHIECLQSSNPCLPIALCEEGFCLNGGECLFPFTNCTCPHGWEGDQCEIGILQLHNN